MSDFASFLSATTIVFAGASIFLFVTIVVVVVYSLSRNYVSGYFCRTLAQGIMLQESGAREYTSFASFLTDFNEASACPDANSERFELINGVFILYLRDRKQRLQMKIYGETKAGADEKLSACILRWRDKALAQSTEQMYARVRAYPKFTRLAILLLNYRFLNYRQSAIDRFSKVFVEELPSDSERGFSGNNHNDGLLSAV